MDTVLEDRSHADHSDAIPHNSSRKSRTSRVGMSDARIRSARSRWARISESTLSFLILADAMAVVIKGWASVTGAIGFDNHKVP